MPHDHGHCGGASHGGHEHNAKQYGSITLISAAIFVAEVVGGWLSHNLALIADALHVFSDGANGLISWHVEKTLHKHKVANGGLAAEEERRLRTKWLRVSGWLLLGSLCFITLEAVRHLANPDATEAWSIAVAILGGLGNLWQYHLIPKERNATTEAQRRHTRTDASINVIVIVGSVIVELTGWNVVIPVLSLVIVALTVTPAYRMTRGQSCH
ncbi:MAG TPA: cation transporter [Candidatus Paceibacterota bacterium]